MIQLPLFTPDVQWTPPKVSELPSWRDAKRVSVDVESKDPDLKRLGPGVRRGGYVVGVSFAIEDGPAHYVPIRHAGGDNVENPEHAIQYFKDQAKIFTGDICGAGIQYDLDYLAEEGIIFREAEWIRDCQIAEPLLDELQLSYSLENIARRRGLPGKDETKLLEAAKAYGIDHKAELWKLPARFVAEYGIQDVRLPLQLLRRQEREIDEQELWGVYNLESRLTPVLVKMRRRGIRVDFDRLDQVEKWAEKEEERCLQLVFDNTLVRIAVGDVWKAGALVHAFHSIGATVPKTDAGNWSVDKAFLSRINHPVAKAILRARKVNKLRTTFAKSIREHAVNDRIHCTFNQLRKTDEHTDSDEGARYGRLSCVKPNLQQQPSRDDFAKLWRSIYIPDEGGMWACNDFSQQEPRWLVHFAELTKCTGAKLAADRYRNDPKTDNHTMMAQIIYDLGDNGVPTKVQRDNSKIIYLGKCYGMGGAKLAHALGLPTKWIYSRRKGCKIEVAGDEAQAIIDLFDKRGPFIKELATLCTRQAKKKGYIKTVSGRRCRFPEDGKGSYEWTHAALNRLIQGSSGDQAKTAMIEADRSGYRVQLQVHDELDQTVGAMKEARGLATLMRECVKANVPFKVDTEVGRSWGEAREWKCDTLAERLLLGRRSESICTLCAA